IAKFIEKRGEGLHHLAFGVVGLESRVEEEMEKGFRPLSESKDGADNKRIVFLHPKTTNNVLVELCEDKSS
ncbi:MAG: VOC family protein, partial [Flavobacteriales bacterium]